MFLLVGCVFSTIGCRRAAERSVPITGLRYEPADLDFRAARSDARIGVAVSDETGRRIPHPDLVLELGDTESLSRRVLAPSRIEDAAALFDIDSAQRVASAYLWVYDPRRGLAVYPIPKRRLSTSETPLRFRLAGAAAAQEVEIADPDGNPLRGLRVAPAEVFAIPYGVGIGKELPEALWESCREVTDDQGIVTLRVADGMSIGEIQAAGYNYGTQRIRISPDGTNTHRLAETGIVAIRLDDSVELDAIDELLFVSNWERDTYGFHRVKEPGPRELEFRMAEGPLTISATCNRGPRILVAATPKPWQVQASQPLRVVLSAEDGCEVTGRLVAGTGDKASPLIGAALTISTPAGVQRGPRAITDEEGRFSAHVPTGEFRIEASVVTPATVLFLDDPMEQHASEAGQRIDVGVLSLPTLFEISGKLVGPDGSPMNDTQISCVADGKVVGGGKTDGEGRFTALVQSSDVDSFTAWPAGILMRYEVDVESWHPLRLRVRSQ